MTTSTQNAPKSLDSVLKQYGAEAKHAVTQILAEYGVRVTDPIAAVISSIYAANLQNLAELARVPTIFQDQVKNEVESFGALSQDLKEQLRGILAQKNFDLSKELGTELGKVVEKAVIKHCQRIDRVKEKQFWVMAGLPALGIAGLLMWGGVGYGYARGMDRISQGGQAKILSSAELAALQWLTSEEGKQAWEMGVHNRGVIQQCFEGLE
ncbi:hypothetical protein Lepto7375DRAFT_0712 [Leptolyngbya sp. PCC 7375]|nr:hypothetical protein Lepto7375DRAFT_0712 [Leptolyngbya sp. PCC 7375]